MGDKSDNIEGVKGLGPKKLPKIDNIINLPKDAYKILVLKEFPLNDNGKISYSSLVNIVS